MLASHQSDRLHNQHPPRFMPTQADDQTGDRRVNSKSQSSSPQVLHHRRERRARLALGSTAASRVSGRRGRSSHASPSAERRSQRFRGRLYRRSPLRNRAMSRAAPRTSMSAKSVRLRSTRAGAQARRRVFAIVLARGIRAYRWDARRILAVSVATLRPQRGQREASSPRLGRSASHSGSGDPRAPSSQRDAPPRGRY
jgi:hypothetical protein